MQTPEAWRIRDAREADLPAINAIYNHEILHGVATWEVEPWSMARRSRWLGELAGDASTPVLVAEREGAEREGRVLGFGYLSWYRPRTGYRFTREDTLYVAPEAQGQGAGHALLGALVERARAAELHCLLAVIEASNAASLALHERHGFEAVGTQREIGRKFDRWLDAVLMERLL